ncbi:uncharacterized protein C8A04DRAFT_32837 [Dichotomopilus funicola]|uniref:J domain-containing protein n=1 Tax=Dichotomopilus funicola TaxID=1934379 RepID=A0AAN6UVD5_9PEZI|nr:hypothetical protein C8A04DRAFT_32837 [Dichotomopilus funicola]
MLLLSAANITFLLLSAISPYAADCLVTATAQTLHLLLVQAQQSHLIMHWTLGLGLALAIARASALDEVPAGSLAGMGGGHGGETLYTVLRVTTASSNDEIRRAYEEVVEGVMAEKNQSFVSRLLWKQWNPFANPNPHPPRLSVNTPDFTPESSTTTSTTHDKRKTDTDTDPRIKIYKTAYKTLTHPYTRCVYHREANLPEWTGRVPQSCWKQRIAGPNSDTKANTDADTDTQNHWLLDLLQLLLEVLLAVCLAEYISTHIESALDAVRDRGQVYLDRLKVAWQDWEWEGFGRVVAVVKAVEAGVYPVVVSAGEIVRG